MSDKFKEQINGDNVYWRMNYADRDADVERVLKNNLSYDDLNRAFETYEHFIIDKREPGYTEEWLEEYRQSDSYDRELDFFGEFLTEDEQWLIQNRNNFDDLMSYIEATGGTDVSKRNVDTFDIDTGRYLEISVYHKGKPDRTDGQYSDPYDKSRQPYEPDWHGIVYESVPFGRDHEFWRMNNFEDGAFAVSGIDDDHFSICRVLSQSESEKYHALRQKYVKFFSQGRNGRSGHEKFVPTQSIKDSMSSSRCGSSDNLAVVVDNNVCEISCDAPHIC